nr:dihydrodipicolinate reductase [bacterium]
MNPIRVVQWGLGAMGSGMARLVLSKPGLRLVGCVDSRPDLAGRDAGEVLGAGPLGMPVTTDAARLLAERRPDVVLIATTSWIADQQADLETIVSAGANCVSIAEEMSAPAAADPARAERLDQLARRHGVSVVGTGVNPGFVLDLLVVLLTAGCHDVRSVTARRVNDLSPYGPTVMRTQGVGLSPAGFAAGVADGSVVGHVGFPQSVRLISDALGLGVDRIEEAREPIVTEVRRTTAHVTVEPGMVAGCDHRCVGYRGRTEVIRLIHPQQVRPDLGGQDTGDRITIDGTPSVSLTISPEYAGGLATQALAVNVIPHLVRATPGLKSMLDLPVPAALMGPPAYLRRP